eukprot:86055-Pelagomonas_calceolata.AAC.10
MVDCLPTNKAAAGRRTYQICTNKVLKPPLMDMEAKCNSLQATHILAREMQACSLLAHRQNSCVQRAWKDV